VGAARHRECDPENNSVPIWRGERVQGWLSGRHKQCRFLPCPREVLIWKRDSTSAVWKRHTTRNSTGMSEVSLPILSIVCYSKHRLESANNQSQSCPTRKYTWPVYETLAVCSQCADISNLLTHTCITSKVDWTSKVKGGFNAVSKLRNRTMCGYLLDVTSPDPILMSGHLVNLTNSTADEALMTRALPLTTMTGREPLYGNGSINFKHMRNTIIDVLLVSAVDGTVESVYQKRPPSAHECKLSWCVQTIRSSCSLGNYEEEIIQTHLYTTEGSFPWLSVPLIVIDNGNGRTYTICKTSR
jgi:hypothetical protein